MNAGPVITCKFCNAPVYEQWACSTKFEKRPENYICEGALRHQEITKLAEQFVAAQFAQFKPGMPSLTDGIESAFDLAEAFIRVSMERNRPLEAK